MKLQNIVIATPLFLAACGGTGTLEVTTWGEDFIEDEIPATAFADGFRVTFSKFLVNLRDVEVRTADGEIGASLPEARVFDLSETGPFKLATLEGVAAAKYDVVSARLGPASGAIAGNASADDVARMNAEGYSVFVIGQGSRSSTVVTFTWGFKTDTRFVDCAPESQDQAVVVPTDGRATADLTIHGDHLFYDDLQDADAKLRFEAIARADASADGDVTLGELAAVDLTTLPAGTYGTGSVPNVRTLADFVGALTRTLLHFNGEGECRSTNP